MLAKLTSRNVITLPEEVAAAFQGTEYFDVVEDGGRLVLTPTQLSPGDIVRQELKERGITQNDIDDAVKWARGNLSL